MIKYTGLGGQQERNMHDAHIAVNFLSFKKYRNRRIVIMRFVKQLKSSITFAPFEQILPMTCSGTLAIGDCVIKPYDLQTFICSAYSASLYIYIGDLSFIYDVTNYQYIHQIRHDTRVAEDRRHKSKMSHSNRTNYDTCGYTYRAKILHLAVQILVHNR